MKAAAAADDDKNALENERKRKFCLGRSLIVLVGIGAVCAIVGLVLGLVLPREKTENSNGGGGGSNNSSGGSSSSEGNKDGTAFPVVLFGSFELLDTVQHDPTAFTQGLELVPNSNPLEYFESTGLYGRSSVRRVDLTTGQILQRHDLTDEYFGEGLTYFDDGKLIQITWQEQTAFIYNATNLDVLDVIFYETITGEGWGICYVEESQTLLVTDGSEFLHTWDASALNEPMDRLAVRIRYNNESSTRAMPLGNLNELEWDRHSQTVLANVWQEDYIVRIDPTTGAVLNHYDLSDLYRTAQSDVLNGMAITDTPNELWVTGKLWPFMYLIRLVD